MEVPKDNNRTNSEVRSLDGERGVPDSFSGLIFVHRKTERVVAALFLITEYLGADNPIRHKVRTLGVDLMSFILVETRNKSDLSDRSGHGFISRLLEIASLLEVAYMAEQLSEMNVRLLGSEIERLVFIAEKTKRQNESSLQVSTVSKMFISENLKDRGLGVSHRIRQRLFDKKTVVKTQKAESKNFSPLDIQKPSQFSSRDNKEGRRKAIINALQGGKKMGVKDFINVLYGVGEKTIQRELAALVESGVLNREGERRWSKYSLSNITGNGTNQASS